MQLNRQKILITGGSSGIGLELAQQLIARQNTVIICGRSAYKLAKAKESVPKVHTIVCDISVQADRVNLLHWVKTHHASCNVLVNNAAIVNKTDFRTDDDMLEKVEQEIYTNLLAPIALAKMFLPLLDKHADSAIINITTGLVYTPRAVYPIYNATKAGLHSFTQVLRHQLKKTNVRVLEVMMPVVDTPWHKGDVPKMAIPAKRAVAEMIANIENGKEEIRVGAVRLLYLLSRIAPSFAFRKINQIS